jgi:D-alanyl-D-alanine carboxypeptidase/D-alanyl-D-alanine-endopeptidase (penicillin-binding protein 4)
MKSINDLGFLKSVVLLLCLLFFASCKTNKLDGQKKTEPIIDIDRIEAFSSSFHGLMIKDLANGQVIYAKNQDKYFTPASNTKILSLYTALNCFRDSIPGLKYSETDSTVTISGLGDPTLLHRLFSQDQYHAFFTSRKHKKFYHYYNFPQKRLGLGWMWDDSQYAYQAELSGMPIYDNLVEIKTGNGSVSVVPKFFIDKIRVKDTTLTEIYRMSNNEFIIPKSLATGYEITEELKPFAKDQYTIIQLLRDTFKIDIVPTQIAPSNPLILYSQPLDTVMRLMMQVSDNMIAEQTMIMAAGLLRDTLSTEVGINYMVNTYLSDMPQPFKWRDGSGLSRYNMFTPASLVTVLERMYRDYSKDRLFSLMAIGGGNGTLKNMFNGDKPYIFAKTGSLNGVYALSGYLITKSGKTFVFSFMNNNFAQPTSVIRREVQNVLKTVRDRY